MNLWHLDAVGMRAHPARETRRDAGLLLQATGGYTQRANSAVPLLESVPDADAAVAAALDFYAERGLPATFRLPSFVDDAALRTALDAAGFDTVSPTRVMTLALPPSRRASPLRTTTKCEFVRDVAAWCALHDELSGLAPAHDAHANDERLALIARIDARIETTRLMARLDVNGETIGAGIVVIDANCAGLYSLVVTPSQRGRGLGAVLIEQLHDVANTHGATHAYLQVAADNPACRLYERLGFVERYAYAYFVESKPDADEFSSSPA